LTVQTSHEHLTACGIAARLDQGGVHTHARHLGVQVEVSPLQSQHLTDA
jgi:hypothetical protein